MKDILTVSQLNDHIKSFLEEAFGALWVEGEVSNLRRPGSGHTYFTLKDDKSQVRAVYFRQYGVNRTPSTSFTLEDGAKILCRARLSAYPPRGEYQLIVESVEPLGVGALQKAFEQLKAKLAAEGLFDHACKKALPFLPMCIGVITSPTGAVIRDILNVTRRRFPSVNILIAPARVQGAEAAGEIRQALSRLQKTGMADVIIIARGGGSLEDLAPFNDEALAREIFRCPIPVISAVGHETDFTICDFVADLRAPTPSAAAELAVPHRMEMLADLADLNQRLLAASHRRLDDEKERLASLQSRFKDPRRFLMDFQIHLDDMRERLARAMQTGNRARNDQLRKLDMGLRHESPQRAVREKKILLAHLEKNLHNAWHSVMSARRERLSSNASLLESLSPLAVLQRGYSITKHLPSSAVLKNTDTLMINDRLSITLARGRVEATVEKISGE
ncbi:MAG: exodeoxyribonuclease VII large subunit [Smithellaceae bacterium]